MKINLIRKIFLTTFLIISFAETVAYSQENHRYNESGLTEIIKDLTFLSSDSLKGRYPATVEDSIAAYYIAQQLTCMGYHPLIGDNPVIPFKILLKREALPESALTISGVLQDEGIDYSVHPLSKSGKIMGKSFIMNLEQITDPEKLSGLKEKLKDAVAIIKLSDDSLRYITTPLSEAGVKGVIYYNNRPLSEIPPVRASQAPIHIVRATEKSMAEIINGLEVYIEGGSREVIGTTYNVAVVSKKDHNTKMVLTGAHYDHLGIGGKGTGSMVKEIEIHNGADDNASGVAAMMKIARNIKSRGDSLKLNYRYAFAAFGAEEMGLIGSKNLADTLQALSKLPELMINLDMVGRMQENRLQAGGVGTFMGADSLINQINKKYNYTITTTKDGFGPSDHASFYAKDVPVLYFTTGVHKEYHTPNDLSNLINFDGILGISELITDLLEVVSTSGFKIQYQKTSSSQTVNSRSSFNVTFGIIPDFTYEKGDGFRVGSVTPGRAGERAGLKDKDIIIKINETKINNIYDYMTALSKLNKGDTVDVLLVREGKELKLKIEL